MKQYISNSAKDTKQIAKNLAWDFRGGVIALKGELGAGKTTFVQGFAEGLGITEKIISPTFVLIRQHKIPNTNRFLYHIDLYRLENDRDFKSLGLKDLLNNPEHLIIIEWAEKIEKYLPKDFLQISIKKIDQNQRRLTILS